MSVKTAVLRKLIASCLVVSSVIAYENAYDLLERRNRRLYDPRYFHSVALYHDRSNIFGESQNPYSGYVNPVLSTFGNGYDNLGNGIPAGPSRPFRQQFTRSWRLQRRPFRRTFGDFGFRDYSHPMSPQRDYVSHRSGGYYPALQKTLLTPGGFYADEYNSKGNLDSAEIDRFLEESEDKKQKKSDEIYQRSHEGAEGDSLKKEKSGEELHADQVGENKSSVTSNKVVKKGRTTKGFAVHHHKDETGNSTTFFDESSDYGGQSDLRDISDGFGSKRTLEQVVRKGDEKYFKENGGQTKNYSSGLFLGNQKFEKDFSSVGNHEGSEGKFHFGREGDSFAHPKTYRYLNGDPFDFTEEEVVKYY